MATLVSKINDGFIRITQLLKQVNTDLNGKIGDRSSLNTTDKTSIVNAINEVRALVGDGTNLILDTSVSSSKTWSSNKISSEINTAISNLINGADTDSDTLKELADKIAALAQAENGLISATNAQDFTDAQKLQGRSNIDAAQGSAVGDMDSADFVSTINSAYVGS